MAVEGGMWPSQSAKYILWRYENYLHRNGKDGYKSLSPEDLRTMTIEHIMPQTLPEGPETGYDSFDGADAESRRMSYTNQLGNYILISGSTILPSAMGVSPRNARLTAMGISSVRFRI